MLEEQEEASSEYLARIFVKRAGDIYDMNMYKKYFRIEHLETFLNIYWKHYHNYIKHINDSKQTQVEFLSDIYDSAYFNDMTLRTNIDFYLCICINSSVKRERIEDIFYLLFINILKSYRNSRFAYYLSINDSECYNKMNEFINIYTEL